MGAVYLTWGLEEAGVTWSFSGVAWGGCRLFERRTKPVRVGLVFKNIYVPLVHCSVFKAAELLEALTWQSVGGPTK